MAQHSIQNLQNFLESNLKQVGQNYIGELDEEKIQSLYTVLTALMRQYVNWYDGVQSWSLSYVQIHPFDNNVVEFEVALVRYGYVNHTFHLCLEYPTLHTVDQPTPPPKPSEVPYEYDPDERFAALVLEE